VNAAFEWIQQIASWIGQFIPRWVIFTTTEGGVKFVRGKNAVALGPGIHWYWPVLTKLEEFPTARQGDDLRSQTIVTMDDKTIVVGGMIVYEVTDILVLLSTTFAASQTVKDICLTAIHDVCCQMTWEELKNEQRRGTLDTKLRNAAQKALSPYGVRIIKTMLTEMAPCRVLKLIQTTSGIEG
jgi:regulator of protease activity HflC (stomatin/prohibitin superfamily)